MSASSSSYSTVTGIGTRTEETFPGCVVKEAQALNVGIEVVLSHRPSVCMAKDGSRGTT